jgi:hypothetical protein
MDKAHPHPPIRVPSPSHQHPEPMLTRSGLSNKWETVSAGQRRIKSVTSGRPSPPSPDPALVSVEKSTASAIGVALPRRRVHNASHTTSRNQTSNKWAVPPNLHRQLKTTFIFNSTTRLRVPESCRTISVKSGTIVRHSHVKIGLGCINHPEQTALWENVSARRNQPVRPPECSTWNTLILSQDDGRLPSRVPDVPRGTFLPKA